jgi:hypothetical protein
MRAIVRTSPVSISRLLGTLGATVIVSQLGCLQSHGDSSSVAENSGSVGVKLTLSGGEQIQSVGWTITGPNGAATVVETGTNNVQNSDSVGFLVGGLPAGTNFSILLSGTSTDGTVTCAGSAEFNVTAGATTNVSVALPCNAAAPDAGSALVNGTTFNCASVTAVTANPVEVTVGSSIAVSASAVGPDASALNYTWTASSGSFDTPGSPEASFTCTSSGIVTLTVTVSDGAVPEGDLCNPALSSTTIQVQCDGGVFDAGGPSCTWTGGPSSAAAGNAELTCYDFAQGTPSDTTFCGYQGTETTGNTGSGACQLGELDTVPNVVNPQFFAAFPAATFGQGIYCGLCLDITFEGTTILATVVDECPNCTTSGHLALSASAAIALGVGVGSSAGDPTSGITWTSVSCPVTGDIVAVFNGGASSQIFFQNVVFPVTSAESSGGLVATLTDGFWDFGASVEGQSVTLTDTLNHSTTGVIPVGGGSIGAQFINGCP